MLLSILKLSKRPNIHKKCIFRWVEVKPKTKYILHNFTPQTSSMPVGQNKKKEKDSRKLIILIIF